MEDIAPGLLLRIKASFRKEMSDNQTIQELLKKIEEGTATYRDAEQYALQIGEALSKAFVKNLGDVALPDGKMYYNIADRVLRPMLEEDHTVVSDAARLVQESLNQKAGIGLKAKTVAVNENRVQGIVDKVSNAESFKDVAWVLEEPVKNFSMNIVDESIRENVSFQGKAGLQPRVIRRAEWKCCPWCSALAGEYTYPDVPDDVYRRHENCRCTVEYDPGDGRRQDVHTKKWIDKDETLTERQNFVGISNEKRVRELPEKTGPSVTNVFPEYFRNSNPGKGSITYDNGFNKLSHADEVKTAQWLLRTFGGDIVLLTESEIEGEKRADFLWNGRLWDLKTVSTAKAADSAVRKGLKQIFDNPGGIILDYGNNPVSMDNVKKIINARMLRGGGNNADIIIAKEEKVIEILRYKK